MNQAITRTLMAPLQSLLGYLTTEHSQPTTKQSHRPVGNLILPSLVRHGGQIDGKVDQLSGRTTVPFGYSDATSSRCCRSGRLRPSSSGSYCVHAFDCRLISPRLMILPASSNSKTPPQTPPPHGKLHIRRYTTNRPLQRVR